MYVTLYGFDSQITHIFDIDVCFFDDRHLLIHMFETILGISPYIHYMFTDGFSLKKRLTFLY
jgi:hypothetical protein